jgi:hypothetical protein
MHSNILVSLGLAFSASAHMLMNTPQPWGPIGNGPLLADGSDFPCKGVAYDRGSLSNVIQKGTPSPLKFTGSAVHGGGSCQLSITTDLNPTKDSVWKVIKSYEGGCPAAGVAGNNGDNANAPGPTDYTFEIPEDVPAGEYTFSWSWLNKIGNREFYQNCAPITAVGSAGDASFLDSLPDMFVANIGNGCETVEGDDTAYPNPGLVVERPNGSSAVRDIPAEKCPNAGYGSGGGSGSGSEDDEVETPVETEAPTAPTVKPSLPGGVFITVPTNPGAAPTATAQPTIPEQPETPVEEPEEDEDDGDVIDTPVVDTPEVDTPIVEAPVDNGNSGSGFAAGTACTDDGVWNCIGGNSFQRCASGAWSPIQQLARGTSCTAGVSKVIQISKRDGKPFRFGAKFIM